MSCNVSNEVSISKSIQPYLLHPTRCNNTSFRSNVSRICYTNSLYTLFEPDLKDIVNIIITSTNVTRYNEM